MAELVDLTTVTGNLRAICPTCEKLMYRRVRIAALPVVFPGIAVTVAQS
ncbi:MAG: hypothetical protein PSV46_00325 [Reyranella sp.]|nr:hypothetical protein [Reyranella sp.]